MKKIILILGFFLVSTTMFGQAKKPTIMVVPSDNWCFTNGYIQTFSNQGIVRDIPDYRLALQRNDQLGFVLGKISSLMSDRGFPLKNLEGTLNVVENQTARTNMMSSKSGASVSENPIDLLNRTAKADIIMQLTWTIKSEGPKKYVTYNLQGLDAYTGKQVAGAQGIGQPSLTASEDLLVEEAVLENMDAFCAQLQQYFDEMFQIGREVNISIHVWDDSPVDLESEFSGRELAEIIDDWMSDNSQEHRYSKSYGSENEAYYEQVRIPLYNEKGKPMDAESFGNQLRKYLRGSYQIETKGSPAGLGVYYIYIGGK